MMRSRIGRARSFGGNQNEKPGGRETALRRKKNWSEKDETRGQFILWLTAGFRGLERRAASP